jgi:hypothetical protein
MTENVRKSNLTVLVPQLRDTPLRDIGCVMVWPWSLVRQNIPFVNNEDLTPFFQTFCLTLVPVQTFRYFGRSRRMSGSSLAIARSERKKVR